MGAMKRWWVRWYETAISSFEYHGPWWISGETMEDPPTHIVVAAVIAESEDAARSVIESAHDDHSASGIREWSFVNERAPDWEPFGDRFQRAPWMKWPYPEAQP